MDADGTPMLLLTPFLRFLSDCQARTSSIVVDKAMREGRVVPLVAGEDDRPMGALGEQETLSLIHDAKCAAQSAVEYLKLQLASVKLSANLSEGDAASRSSIHAARAGYFRTDGCGNRPLWGWPMPTLQQLASRRVPPSP